MNRKTFSGCAVVIYLAVILFGAASAKAALLAFRVTALSTSTFINGDLLLDIPAINAHPGADLIVAQNYNATAEYNSTYTSGSAENYLDDPVGVRYDTSRRRWFIYDETGTAIPVGASFNILVAPCERVLATALNSQASETFFPLGRNTPGALLFVTHLFNPNLTLPGGVSYPHPAGVGFDSNATEAAILNHWYVSSEDATPAEAAAWFVFDSSPYKRVRNLTTFTVSSNAGSNDVPLPTSRQSGVTNLTTTAGFAFSNSALNGNPNAVIFITHLMNGGAYNQVTGVFYNGSQWCIVAPSFTQPLNVESFNVLAFSAASP